MAFIPISQDVMELMKARNPRLVRKQITVQGPNGSYQRMAWVLPGEAGAEKPGRAQFDLFDQGPEPEKPAADAGNKGATKPRGELWKEAKARPGESEAERQKRVHGLYSDYVSGLNEKAATETVEEKMARLEEKKKRYRSGTTGMDHYHLKGEISALEKEIAAMRGGDGDLENKPVAPAKKRERKQSLAEQMEQLEAKAQESKMASELVHDMREEQKQVDHRQARYDAMQKVSEAMQGKGGDAYKKYLTAYDIVNLDDQKVGDAISRSKNPADVAEFALNHARSLGDAVPKPFMEKLERIAAQYKPAAAATKSAPYVPGIEDAEVVQVAGARPDEAPEGWIVFNAPRPISGTKMWQGPFTMGVFYAAVDPADELAERFVAVNKRDGASILEYATRGEIISAEREKLLKEFPEDKFPEEAQMVKDLSDEELFSNYMNRPRDRVKWSELHGKAADKKVERIERRSASKPSKLGAPEFLAAPRRMPYEGATRQSLDISSAMDRWVRSNDDMKERRKADRIRNDFESWNRQLLNGGLYSWTDDYIEAGLEHWKGKMGDGFLKKSVIDSFREGLSKALGNYPAKKAEADGGAVKCGNCGAALSKAEMEAAYCDSCDSPVKRGEA